MKIAGTLVAVATGLGLWAGAAAADDVSDFYSDTPLTIVTAGGAAGPYNVLVRSIEPYLKKYLPGNPDIIVQAMPGAGGLTAANYLYNIAEKDGSVIGITLPTIAMNQAFDTPGVQYDATKFNYLISVQQSPIVIGVSKASGIESWKDATQKEVVLGSTGVSSNTSIVPALMNSFLGTKFKIVTGYQGQGAIELAFERDEVAGMGENWTGIKSTKPDWIENGTYHMIAQTNLEPVEGLENVPTLVSIAPTDEAREVFEFYGLANSLGRVFVTPPGVPEDRVEALRKALIAVMQDPDFDKDAAQRDIDPHAVEHAKLEELVSKTVNYDPSVIDTVKKAITVE